MYRTEIGLASGEVILVDTEVASDFEKAVDGEAGSGRISTTDAHGRRVLIMVEHIEFMRFSKL